MWQANRALGYGLSGAIAVRDALAAYGRFVASPFARRDKVVVMAVVLIVNQTRALGWFSSTKKAQLLPPSRCH